MRANVSYPVLLLIAALVLGACAAPELVAGTAAPTLTALAPTLEAAATQVAPTLEAVATQLAPTVEAAATALPPTAAAAATQLASTAEAAATGLPPTAAAVATQLAPTLEAAGTALAPTVAALAGCAELTADTALLLNVEHGYCVLYPNTHTAERPNPDEVVITQGGLLDVQNPRVHIEVSDAAGRTAAQAADAIQSEGELVMGAGKVPRSTITLSAEEAVVLDNLPGQDINRRVFVVHDGRLYDLTFFPLDPNIPTQVQAMEPFYRTIIESFHFLG